MKRRIKVLALVTAILASFALILSGCGAQNGGTTQDSSAQGTTVQSSDTQQTTAETTESTAAKTKIVIATGGMPKPFSYVNDKNEIEGYDIDVVRAIFKELPQYEISIEKTEFTSIFAGLDSDRYQIGANNFAMNDQRKEKYIYTKPIFKNQFVIAVAENRTDISSFKDLQGKSTEVQPGVNYTTALENYNKAHSDNPVKLNYSKGEMIQVLQNVESGKYDFQVLDAPMLNTYIKDFGLKLKAISLSEEDTKLIGVPYSYLILSKGQYGQQLEKDINGALDKLIQDGTVGQISVKYFGGDFSPK